MKNSSNYAQMSKEDLISELAKAHETIAQIEERKAEEYGMILKDSDIEDAIVNVDGIITDVKLWLNGPELSPRERQRLSGLQARRYGFIDEVSDIITTNPQFIPSNMTAKGFKDLIRTFELIRNMNLLVQQTGRLLTDIQLILGDQLFQMALSYYGSVQSAARRRVPGAQELFDFLKGFFRRRRMTSDEPTERQLERDFHALEHGAKDGEIIIKNERAHLEGGAHAVVDDTHAARATKSEEIRMKSEE